MPSAVQLEQTIVSAEYYFANLMSEIVSESLELKPVNEQLSYKVNNLYYAIEALRFLVDRGIDTSNTTCLNAYKTLMTKIGVNVTLPNQEKDDSLIILFNE